jgi:hypothetical protein
MQKAMGSWMAGAMALILSFCLFASFEGTLYAQGVTTAAMSGLVTDTKGEALIGANVVVVHVPTGTQYGTAVRAGGAFNIPNMKVGGPYTISVSYVGYKAEKQENIYLGLGQTVRVDFKLAEEAVFLEGVEIVAEQDEVLNSDRTGAATFIKTEQVTQLPSIKRSTRDLTRLDPRSDGNFSFGGRNWLYNNISLDGSYFNNPFGLDDPAPGGQTNAEPVPFDAIEQVQVSIAPFDVREGGFTGANINSVTKSGTNELRGSVYRYTRNEGFIGSEVGAAKVLNPDLSFNQSGFTFSGPLIRNKLFFFVNGEIERRDDPGTNFSAARPGQTGTTVSRVEASIMDQIRQRMIDVYQYDPGPYEGYIHETNNDKILLKLDWNINDNHNLAFRYNFLDAKREQGPHPFAISFNNTGRGPNENSLPFKNSGYAINNELNSFALEINSRSRKSANRFFASYNRFRDFRTPFSGDFPTIEIGLNGITYTTVGHEPFSIHNILDQDVWQFTNNFIIFSGKHVLTLGANFETFGFFNSFNLFRHGFFGFTNTFDSPQAFLAATDPSLPASQRPDFRGMIAPASRPFKGEDIDVGQLAFYVQDEYPVSKNFNITAGLRADFPIYFTDPVDNPFSRSLNLLDENDARETVDQSKLPDVKLLFSPRIGFNWDVKGDRSTQVRGGTGIFTGRLPFVWIGNNISNPGPNPNLPSHLRTGDINAMASDFKWPQVWNTNIAVDHMLPWDLLGTAEFIYGKDINAIFIRNANLRAPVPGRTLSDGRPYFGGAGNNRQDSNGGGVYVIDNTSDGRLVNFTAQLRKNFGFGLNASLAYSFLEAKNQLSSTEIAQFLWEFNPVKGDPNKPELSFSEFGNRHRIVAGATYSKRWSNNLATHFGLFVERAEGATSTAAARSRFSFTYAGDVNGDGSGGNDLIYIPSSVTNPAEIVFADIPGGKTAAQQAQDFEAFIRQDDYLSSHRGQIAERNGGITPWFTNVDLRILQDVSFNTGSQKQTFQISLDVLNVLNLLDPDWGVREIANSAAKSPLVFTGSFAANNVPIVQFPGTATKTFLDDASILSRWQIQLGVKYFFN